jgi:hypothetical protein
VLGPAQANPLRAELAGDRIVAVREMILADDTEGRRAALAKILPYQRQDFVELLGCARRVRGCGCGSCPR